MASRSAPASWAFTKAFDTSSPPATRLGSPRSCSTRWDNAAIWGDEKRAHIIRMPSSGGRSVAVVNFELLHVLGALCRSRDQASVSVDNGRVKRILHVAGGEL